MHGCMNKQTTEVVKLLLWLKMRRQHAQAVRQTGGVNNVPVSLPGQVASTLFILSQKKLGGLCHVCMCTLWPGMHAQCAQWASEHICSMHSALCSETGNFPASYSLKSPHLDLYSLKFLPKRLLSSIGLKFLLVLTHLQCPTHLGTDGIQGSYTQLPCLTFNSLHGSKLAMCRAVLMLVWTC